MDPNRPLNKEQDPNKPFNKSARYLGGKFYPPIDKKGAVRPGSSSELPPPSPYRVSPSGKPTRQHPIPQPKAAEPQEDSSSTVLATEEELEALKQAVNQANQQQGEVGHPQNDPLPDGKESVNIDRNRDIQEDEEQDDGEQAGALTPNQPTDDDQSDTSSEQPDADRNRMIEFLAVHSLHTDDRTEAVHNTLKVYAECPFTSLTVLSDEEVAILLKWAHPIHQKVSTTWRTLIDYMRDNSTPLLQYATYIFAMLYQNQRAKDIDFSLARFVLGFVHMQMKHIMAYYDKVDVSVTLLSSVVYDANSMLKPPSLLGPTKMFTEDDLVSLASLDLAGEQPIDIHNEIIECKLIIAQMPGMNELYDGIKHEIGLEASKKKASPVPGSSYGPEKTPSPKKGPDSKPATPETTPKKAVKSKPIILDRTVPTAPKPRDRPDSKGVGALDRVQTKTLQRAIDKEIRTQVDNVATTTIESGLSASGVVSKGMLIIDDDEFKLKYGDDCVVTVGVIDTSLIQASDSQPSTILTVLGGVVNSSYDNYSNRNDGDNYLRVLGTTISLPDFASVYRQMFVNGTFPITILKERNLERFIVQVDPRVDTGSTATLPDSAVAAGTTNLDAKKLTGILYSAVPGIQRGICEGVCHQLTEDVQRHGMMSFFTRMWTIHHALVSCEELAIPHVFQGLVPDDIEVVVIDVPIAQQAAAVFAITEAISHGKYTFLRSEVSDIDLQCMRLISIGPEGVQTLAANRVELITSNIHFNEDIRWMVLTRAAEPVVVPAQLNVTASIMRSFIFKMAKLFGRNDDLVRGYLRSSALTTVDILSVRTAGVVGSAMMNAMTEMHGTTMPQSWPDNFVWRTLEFFAPDNFVPNSDNEAMMLHANNTKYFAHLSTLVGSVISLGYAHVWHMHNITGSVLSAFTRNTPKSKATDLIRGYAESIQTSRVPKISRTASGYISQISNMSINPTVFTSRMWSSYGLPACANNPTMSWRRLHPNRIPYLVQPMALFYVGMMLDSNWGLSKPGVKADFFNETQQYGENRDRIWVASNGFSAYSALASCDQSHQHVQYGTMAINTMMQETRTPVAHTMLFVSFPRVNTTGRNPIIGPPAVWRDFTFEVIPQLFTLKVGTLTSYDWGEEMVKAPVLVLQEQADQMQAIIETSELTLMMKAGLNYQGAYTFTPLNVNVDDAISFTRMSLSGKATKPPSKNAETKAKEEETKAAESIPTAPKTTPEI